jgi:hypothetical protein
MKYITVSDFLSEAQMRRALALYCDLKANGQVQQFAQQFSDEVIAPNIQGVDEKLGQKNDP